MEGTSQKPKSCRFCRVLLVRPLVNPRSQSLNPKPHALNLNYGRPSQTKPPKQKDTCRSQERVIEMFEALQAEMEGNFTELHKSPKVVDFVEAASFAEAISKSLVDFLDFRPLGPPKWREPHKSPKVVDFVESALFAEAISKALLDFMDFRPLGPLK